ncbi:uncharacterized protein KD926_011604 [Aspergillus affinis]|uniref:uncharacterized protein n=1 Tax=Aspergillus affinis TaxID=1070780 RepID=UPI0022FE842E|nr:uncharacterized protein KD926_011604 [Aspergillus affinis]KAI9037815.1 hypothetical protein KD926_011604 [Aspergillus affinis]
MQLFTTTLLIAALGLSTSALAAAIPDPQPAVSEYRWHGCAAGISCTADTDCRVDDGCLSTSGNIVSNIHCGQANHPNSCWAVRYLNFHCRLGLQIADLYVLDRNGTLDVRTVVLEPPVQYDSGADQWRYLFCFFGLIDLPI